MDDDDIIFSILIRNVEEAEEQLAESVPRHHFLSQNPYEVLSDSLFIKHFRLNKACFSILLRDITPYLRMNRRITGIPIQTKLLVSLLFFGQGSYQAVTGSNIFCGLSQSSVSRCIEEVSDALHRQEIYAKWVHFPRNIQEMSQRRDRFFDATGIPGGIGVIDCTHVAIVRPHEEEHVYVNRKNYHSMNVQLICDENLRIMNVNTKFPGSVHDAYIWGQSSISNVMERAYRNDPQNTFFLLGDSGYPLRPWLLTPLRNALPGAEERFNTHFKAVRSTIERCNGVLKNRFRCLLKHRVLHYQPLKVIKIIFACCILHNICISHRIPEPDRDDEFLNADIGIIPQNDSSVEIATEPSDDLTAGRIMRQEIIARNYNN